MKMSGHIASTPPPSLDDYRTEAGKGIHKGGRRSSGAPASIDALTPLVSVITIVRNGVTTLPRAIESVLSQDYRNVDYVVVDGQSTDGTLGVLQNFSNDISLWVSESDSGISDAFNKGIVLSRGEIIGILNCDDWYEPGAIRKVVDAMQKSGADIAAGKMQYWEGDRHTFTISSDPDLLDQSMTVGHPTVFVRRSCYRQIGLYRLDFRFAMDYEWILRAKHSGARFVTLEHCTANMRVGGISDKRWRDGQREVARARALHIPGKNTAWAYYSYLGYRIVKGTARRVLDRLGLGFFRRLYLQWFSPVTVTAVRRHDRQ